ncbi:MAG: helix-turn-helix domain-containing protein [Betaproteobacteria bacterium]|nr:helix-turn-helix domain-containing protein [Betaproteobacteria bacterium]
MGCAKSGDDARQWGADEAPRTSGGRFHLHRGHRRDADEHAEALRHWDQRYEQLSSGPFEGWLTDVWLDEVQVFRERTRQVVLQTGRSWPDACIVGLVQGAEGDGSFCGHPLEAGSAFAFGTPGEFSLRTPARLDVVGIAVPLDAIRRRGDRTGDDAAADRWDRSGADLLRETEALAALNTYVRHFFEMLDRDASPFDHQEARRTFVTSLLDGVEAAVEGARLRDRVPASSPARSALVGRAREFIAGHCAAPMTVADLCAELGSSRRTLQYCFQEVLGVSPVQYLRAVRLNGVRRELKTAGGTARIGDIAARWGFWHLGQFSLDYRRMFGERPSDTLRRAPVTARPANPDLGGQPKTGKGS